MTPYSTQTSFTRLKNISAKDADKYRFILKAGQGFKNCLFKLFQKVRDTESKPGQWRNTIIIQLYKSKGQLSDYNNMRNIHTKEAVPTFFEGMIVDKSNQHVLNTKLEESLSTGLRNTYLV